MKLCDIIIPERDNHHVKEVIRVKKSNNGRCAAAMKNIATLSEARSHVIKNFIPDHRGNEPLHAAMQDLETAFRKAITAESDRIKKLDPDFTQDDSGGN